MIMHRPFANGRAATIIAFLFGVGGCLGQAATGNGGIGGGAWGNGGTASATGGAASRGEQSGTGGGTPCVIGAVTYPSGASWQCDCNTCWCIDGRVISTAMYCIDAAPPGVDASTPDASPDGGRQPIWSNDSARLEVRCGSVGAFGRFCGWSWGADVAELTPEQLAILGQMVPITPVLPQPTCDQGGYVITVVDRSGARSTYWGPAFYANCQEADWYGPELPMDLVRALVSTLQFPDAAVADGGNGD